MSFYYPTSRRESRGYNYSTNGKYPNLIQQNNPSLNDKITLQTKLLSFQMGKGLIRRLLKLLNLLPGTPQKGFISLNPSDPIPPLFTPIFSYSSATYYWKELQEKAR